MLSYDVAGAGKRKGLSKGHCNKNPELARHKVTIWMGNAGIINLYNAGLTVLKIYLDAWIWKPLRITRTNGLALVHLRHSEEAKFTYSPWIYECPTIYKYSFNPKRNPQFKLLPIGLDNMRSRWKLEGGCGGYRDFLLPLEPVPGKSTIPWNRQRLMHNRWQRAKAAGIARLVLFPSNLGVSREILDDCYICSIIAYLEASGLMMFENKYIAPLFEN